MTRWARSGNTQKHKKMPTDPSTWTELSMGLKKSRISNETNLNACNFGNSSSEANSSQHVTGTRENEVMESKPAQFENFSKKLFGDNFNKNSFEKNEDNWKIISDKNCDVPKKALSRRQLKKLKWENNKNTKMNVEGSNGYFKDKISADDSCSNKSVEENKIQEIMPNISLTEAFSKPLSKRQMKQLRRENNKKQKIGRDNEHSNQCFNDKVSKVSDDECTQKSMEINESYGMTLNSKSTETLPKKPQSKRQLKELRWENDKKQKTERDNKHFNQCFSDTASVSEGTQMSIRENDRKVALNIHSPKTLPKKSRAKRKLEKLKLKKSKKRKTEVNNQHPNQSFNNKVLTDEHKIPTLKFVGENDNYTMTSNNKNPETLFKKSFLKQESKEFKIKNEIVQNDGLPNQTKKNTDDQTDSETKRLAEENRLKKKEMFLQKLKERRAANGITLLSPQMENRLYRMKKGLWKKKFAPEEIKDILRKERRKLELEFRKGFVKKTCFNCRKFGHVLADCPLPSNGTNQGAGICFKCGSAEHNSSACKKKVSGYPFATCFICKAEGHISRDCPTNKHGIYINGGKCNLCGNINHLSKDCPKLKKEEEPLTLPTINEGRSVDDEIIDFKKGTVRSMIQKSKIVKF